MITICKYHCTLNHDNATNVLSVVQCWLLREKQSLKSASVSGVNPDHEKLANTTRRHGHNRKRVPILIMLN